MGYRFGQMVSGHYFSSRSLGFKADPSPLRLATQNNTQNVCVYIYILKEFIVSLLSPKSLSVHDGYGIYQNLKRVANDVQWRFPGWKR